MKTLWALITAAPIIMIAPVLFFIMAVTGCGEANNKKRAVYLLLDTSGTYSQELTKAQSIMNYLLATLNSGDSIAIARIDSGSFSEKDIIVKATFDERPSSAIAQKRAFKATIDQFVQSTRKGSRHTDISGGLLQAAEYLYETGAGEKHVLIFSDLEEDLVKGHIRQFELPLDGIQVSALNVTKLHSDNIDPREYLKRLQEWKTRVTEGGGQWRVINDLDRLDNLIVQL
ncbi:MAG: vWA domain-containing protein [Pseudomonadota bacterium]